jgi:putative zinc finger protein
VSHLGRWLSALVDGELNGEERDRVLNHIAGCEACRQETNAMRALKRRLTALGETSADSAIAGRLIELGRSDQSAPVGAVHSSLSKQRSQLDLAAPRGPRQIVQGLRMAAGSAGSALLAIGIIAFLLGNTDSDPPAPKVTPSVDSYLLQHTRDAGEAPAGSGPVTGATQPPAGQQSAAVTEPGLPNPEQFSRRLALLLGPASPGPLTSAAASPRPVTSAVASPAASTPAAVRAPATHVAGHYSR